MIDSLIIRPCETRDLPHLLNLMEELGYPTTQKKLGNLFNRFIKNKGYGFIVACLNETVVGFLAWSRSILFVSDKTRFHIEALVVNKNYKGKGIGKQLISVLEGAAQKCAPAIVDLTSGLRRAKDGSHEFYRKLGYCNEGPMAKLYLRKEIE